MQLISPNSPLITWSLIVAFCCCFADHSKAEYLTREMLCAATENACILACGDEKPLVNHCDAKSLRWNCKCPPGSMQRIIDQAFPIPYKTCQDDFLFCMATCQARSKARGKDPLDCQNDCSERYQCGTTNAPHAFSKTSDARKNQVSLTEKIGTMLALAVTSGFLVL